MNIYVVNSVLTFLLAINLHNFANGNKIEVSCKDESGKNVDWFYLYKLPKHFTNKKSPNEESSGFNYLYMTNNSYENWKLSEQMVNESTSIPALTLEPLFANPLVLLLAYNDEFPNGTVIFDNGHTKGVVATDGKTAIWLIHSVPKYPSIPKYEYPSSGAHYGQSFLCVTLPAAELEKVAEQLLFNQPSVYYSRVPITLDGKYPQLEKVLQKEWIRQAPFNNILDISSLQGKIFKSFAKSSKYHKELYEDFVAPVLDTNLMVETWRNGAGNLDSNCSLNDNVYNIQEIIYDEPQLYFKTSQDHSKWAVSQGVGLRFWRFRIPSTSNWICVGDINRQQHQLQRGGGVLCQQNSKVTKLYRKLIKEYESCNK